MPALPEQARRRGAPNGGDTVNQFTVWVPGRPAPQGSKKQGARGQLLEQSPYLAAWRAAVKRAVLERMLELGIKPGDRPLLRGALGFSACFHMDTGQRIDSPPDLDKLIRATWDPLGPGTPGARGAWLIEDDGRFVVVRDVRKVQAIKGRIGADIVVWQEILEGSGDER